MISDNKGTKDKMLHADPNLEGSIINFTKQKKILFQYHEL